MRLQRLSLDRFGHFTDRHYDFGARSDRPDFHIIYGPNEAGKTTMMEAALRLFYGFPLREGYAFKHQRSNLQVSATLDIDGQLREFTRLPKRSGSLVDATGTALPEAALSAHLAGLSEEDYRQLLCLDDDTIERGGEEIAHARGDIGRLLFSAAAGVADLSVVLDAVRDQADEIWKKRASKTRIAELKRALADVEKTIREHDVSASAWRGLRKTLADAQVEEQAARGAREGLAKTAAEVAAQRRAIPVMVEIAALADRIAPFADYPARLDFDPERLVQLRSEEATARAELDRLDREIVHLTAARDDITIDPHRLALADQLDALEDLHIRDRAATLDLGRRTDQEAAAKQAMILAARDLGVAELADPQAFVLSVADILRLETARDAVRTANLGVSTETQELKAASERHSVAQEACDGWCDTAVAGQAIGDILLRYDVDRLAPAFAAAQHALTTAKQSLAARLRGLAMGQVVFDSLPPCPTTEIKAQDWADRYTDLRSKIDQTVELISQHEADLAARRAQAEALTKDGALVADAASDALQAERDRLWDLHVSALSAATATDFALAMQAVDAAMKTRVARASDLGQLRQIDQTQAEAQARATHAKTALAALRDALAALDGSVTAAGTAVGLPMPLTPVEWLDWVKRHGSAAEAANLVLALQEAHRAVLERAQTLLTCLSPLVPLHAPDVEAAIAAARKLAETERKAATDQAKLHDTLAQAEKDVAKRKIKHQAALGAQSEAQADWSSLILALLGDAAAPETLMASLEPLRTLREQAEKRGSAAQRVATMQADQQQFLTVIMALTQASGMGTPETAAASFAALRSLSDATRTDRDKRADLGKSLEAALSDRTANAQKLALIAQDVAAMASLFAAGTALDSIDALRHAAGQARQVIADRAEIAKLERVVLADLGVADITDAREALADVTTASLDAAAQTIKSDLGSADGRVTKATEDRVTAQQGLAQVTGDATIATLTERKATLELQLEEAAMEHLELSLGHRLASDAIRRYRDSHRSGMLAATERCFAALTQGAYPQLTTLPDGAEEILLALDATGSTKRAADMSKGTRFQLYLALRAAAHEQLVAQGTCLPFFCDDIFETFDEDRTSAACRVMEEIGRKGQAIYLTHHRHVVDLARKVCDTPPTVHEV